MEAYWSERNPRDGDDEESESGSAGEKRSKKKQQRPEEKSEDKHHPLHFGAAGEFLLRKQQEPSETWFGESKSEKDDEATDEEDKAEKSEEPADAETTAVEHEAAESPPHAEVVEPARPPQESLTAPSAEKPAWLEEDDTKFTKIMQREFGGKPLEKAASDDLLTDTEPGRPAAVENAVNDREPVRPVERFNSVQEQRVEGVVPGPPATAEMPAAKPLAEASSEYQRPAPQKLAERPDMPAPRYLEHRRGLREKMAAAALTTVAVTGWLANQRRKQEIASLQKEHRADAKKQEAAIEHVAAEQQTMQHQIVGQQEQFAAIRAQQQRQFEQAQRQAAERFKPPVAVSTETVRPLSETPPAEVPKQVHVKADAEAAARRAVEEARSLEEAAAKPQQEQIVTQDAWLRHVVDKSGHEIQGAVQHGHEYDAERAQEVQGNQPADTIAAHPQEVARQEAAQPAPTTAIFEPATHSQTHSQPAEHTSDSGVISYDHSLPAGMPKPADWQHQLPSGKKHGPITSALTSPWLFLMLSLILLAYFIASLL